MEVILLFSSLFSVIVTSASINSECILNVTNPDYERKLPLPLYNSSSNYELATPHQGLIRLQTGQNISFLCSGIRNYVRQTNANVSTVTCIGDDQVKLFRMVFHIAEISCKNSVRGNVRATQEKCANNQGLVYQIGYQVTRTEWFTLITVCYIPSNGQTLYTRHILYGKEIKYRSKTKYRPDFSSSGQNDQITASLSYNQTFQKLVFNRILKSSLLARKFINDKSFLARGHLSPDADFLLAPTQFSTYFYINTAPQWQRINSANWKSVEITTRDLAVHYGDLDIITGTHDILTYLDQENNFQKIYLGKENVLPVPKYFWKIVFDPKSQKGIVFIILNDPYVELPLEEPFCKDVCVEAGYTKKAWKNTDSGLVFCCDIINFRNIVKSSPNIISTSLLTNPN